MKPELFVVSDIHGSYFHLMELLKNWDKETQELVLNGDLIDRGYRSKDVLLLANQLMHEGVCHVTLGNHDQMMLDFLTHNGADLQDIYDVWYQQGGRMTSCSLLQLPVGIVDKYSPEKLQSELNNLYYVKDTLELFEPYYVQGNVLCVHAGISVWNQENWANLSRESYIWTRDFHKYGNRTGKVVVAGHTPTPLVWEDDDNFDIWVNKERNIIMIDGGCVYGGQLNGVVVDNSGEIKQVYVQK